MLRLIGVIPFAFLPGYIPKIVFFNGIMLHLQRMRGKDSTYRILLAYDTFSNVCLCAYANFYTCYQPQTLCTTLFSLSSFLVNFGKDLRRSALYHVGFVQIPLGICCFMHHQTCLAWGVLRWRSATILPTVTSYTSLSVTQTSAKARNGFDSISEAGYV